MTSRWFLIVAFGLAACTTHVYSPPARGVPLESVRTLAAGHAAVGGEVGGGEFLFGPGAGSGALRVRHGITEAGDLDGNAEATAFVVGEHWGGAGRLGVKYAAAPFLALQGGLGGGGSQLGGFVSPDVGVIGAWENPYVIPFASLSGWVSEPIARSSLRLPVSSDSGEGTALFTPKFTLGVTTVAGLRVPIMLDEERKQRLLFSGGLGFVWMTDTHEDEGILTINGGLELEL